MSNEWNRLPAPPASLFMGDKERKLVKQVNMELEERIIGQQVLYYPLDIEGSNYDEMYGECLEKQFLPPIRVYCLVNWEGSATVTDRNGIDRLQTMTIHFHKRRLVEDQDIFVQEGDVVLYGDDYYEIVTLNENQQIWGDNLEQMEIAAKCIKAREDFFIGEKEII